MVVRLSDDPTEQLTGLLACCVKVPEGAPRELFQASLFSMLQNQPPFKILLAGPKPLDHVRHLQAAALISFAIAPMQEEKYLTVECVQADVSGDVCTDIVEALVDFARSVDFAGVCFPFIAPGVTALLGCALQGRAPLGVRLARAPRMVLQAVTSGLWTGLNDGPSHTRAQFVDCLIMTTVDVPSVASGVEVDDDAALGYRGEGRWGIGRFAGCGSLGELVDLVERDGFPARVDDPFTGALSQQLLHQGYADQGTVSLTTSRAVATTYATGGSRDGVGAVFTVDLATLRADGPVFDGIATLRSHWRWLLASEEDALERILSSVGIRRAGHLLEQMFEVSRERVVSGREAEEAFSGGNTRGAFLDTDLRDRLLRTVSASELDSLLNAFDVYWMFAEGRIGSVDAIDAEGEVTTSSQLRDPFLYQHTFREIEPVLVDALAVHGARDDHRRGWDLTAFGYAAKAVLDHELFSSGGVAARHVTGVHIINGRGKTLERIVFERG